MIDKNRFNAGYIPFDGSLKGQIVSEQTTRFSTELEDTDSYLYARRVEQIKEHRTDVLTPPINTTPAGVPIPVGVGYVSRDIQLPIIARDDNGVVRARLGAWEEDSSIPIEVDPNPLGVYRPNLEDRKVGKVRVELVDDGFPLALREVAKVMTWAQTAKGYKDHDWQNLPNAEQALAAATSRHRTDYIIQRKVDGLSPEMCVDHESEIVHKAHEAFGVLAQLELLLRGEFK